MSGSKIWNYRVPYPEWLYGAAGLNISALDLAKFDAALSAGTLLEMRRARAALLRVVLIGT